MAVGAGRIYGGAGVRFRSRRPRRSGRKPRRPRPRGAAGRRGRDDRRRARHGDVGGTADRRQRGGRPPPREPARRRRGGLRDARPRSARALPAALGRALRRGGRRAGAPRASRRDRRRAEPARPASPACAGCSPMRRARWRGAVWPPLRPRLRAGAHHRRVRAAGADRRRRALATVLAERVGADVRLIAAGDEAAPRRGWPTPRSWRPAPARRASRAAGPGRSWPRRAGTSTCSSSPGPTTRSCARPPARCWWSPPPAARRTPVAAQAVA